MIRRSKHGKRGEEWCAAYREHSHVGPLVIWWSERSKHALGWLAVVALVVLLALAVGGPR